MTGMIHVFWGSRNIFVDNLILFVSNALDINKLAEQISGNKIKANKLRDVFPPFHIPIEKSEVNYRLPRGDCGEIFAQFNAFLGL